MPPPIKKLADQASSPTPSRSRSPARPPPTCCIEQRLVQVDARKKRDALADILRNGDVRSAIVFCNRKTTVRELATSLKRGGLNVGQIQGDMDQSDRIAELDRFKNDEINILVASDVAARGLDIKGVSHVFNFDVPWHPDDYIHRIGRTGRAGKTGIAITLVTGADAESIDNIQKLTGTKIARMGDAPRNGDGAERRTKRANRARPAQPRESREPRESRGNAPPGRRARPRAPRSRSARAGSPARRRPSAGGAQARARRRAASASRSPKQPTKAGTARCRASSARASAAD